MISILIIIIFVLLGHFIISEYVKLEPVFSKISGTNQTHGCSSGTIESSLYEMLGFRIPVVYAKTSLCHSSSFHSSITRFTFNFFDSPKLFVWDNVSNILSVRFFGDEHDFSRNHHGNQYFTFPCHF